MQLTLRSFCFVALGVLFVPAVALAAPGTFSDLVSRIVSIINLAIPALISAAIVLFMYNILGSFGIFGGENTFDKQKFRDAALWGIIILFVLVSIWGILEILRNTFLSSGGGASVQTTTETSFR